MSLAGVSYYNSYRGYVEEVTERHRFENLGMCNRCNGFVEPPDDASDPNGVYICCRCGRRFVVA